MSVVVTPVRLPSYRLHKPSGQAVVTLGGKDFYLGKWNSKASRQEYDRLICEWLAGGRASPPGEEASSLTVAELCLRYWQFAKGYYRKDGRPTAEVAGIRVTLRMLRTAYGSKPVSEFGPLALKVVRQTMLDQGHCRRYANANTARIKRMFKWGVAEELVPSSVLHALQAVPGLRRGRTQAREPDPIQPVDDEVVEATLPHLPTIVGDMVRLQRLCGCRPGEVCMIRPCDVDTSGEVWLYQPESHKTEHHGHGRIICLGPKAQDVLRPYLLREKTAYCFSPAESERKRRAANHEARKTPLSCGNRPGTNRKRKPKKNPGDRYDACSYRRAIHRAVDLANQKRQNAVKQGGPQPRRLPRWSPNRLRHAAATEIRKQFGLEAAQVALGHRQADVTQIYAERNLTLAAEVARKIG